MPDVVPAIYWGGAIRDAVRCHDAPWFYWRRDVRPAGALGNHAEYLCGRGARQLHAAAGLLAERDPAGRAPREPRGWTRDAVGECGKEPPAAAAQFARAPGFFRGCRSLFRLDVDRRIDYYDYATSLTPMVGIFGLVVRDDCPSLIGVVAHLACRFDACRERDHRSRDRRRGNQRACWAVER